MTAGGAGWAPIGPDPFGWNLPTRIRFGYGVSAEAGAEAARSGGRVALITGRSFAANPAAAELRSSLDTAATVVEHIVVTREPDDEVAIQVTRSVVASGATVIVAVGGGSVIDSAKVAGVLCGLGEAALPALLGGQRLEERVGLPVIALPTTAGSGAEVSHGAIILDRAAGRKRGVRGPGVAATVALVDPALGRSSPPEVTASAGFDAVAHAIETAVSRAASPMTRAFSADALARLLRAVPRLLSEPDDRDARADAAFAALLMGANLANSTTCLPHRLQYPVGAATGSIHAAGVAALFPAWLRRTAVHATPELAQLATATGLSDAAQPAVAAAALVAAVERHLDETSFRWRLADFGLTEAEIPRLVASVEGTLGNDPGPVGPADLADLYRASL